MPDTWIVIPKSILRKTDLEWLLDYFPDQISEVPFGYFSDIDAEAIESQVKMFLLIEAIKK